MRPRPWLGLLTAGLLAASPARAAAQLYEDVGTRAQGLAGAFVAVADDASAVWWNPAGIATGAYFNVLFEKGRVTQPESPVLSQPARRASTTGFAIAVPSLGVSYHRIRVSEIATSAPTGSVVQNRQDLEGEARSLSTLAATQFGLTVAQALVDQVVVASTFKVVRGGVESRLMAAGESGDPLDLADDFPIASETHTDLDLGVMAVFQHVRAGLTVRNLRQARFDSGDEQVTLKRQARAGLAILAGPAGPVDGFSVSGDADLTRSATPFGEVRHAAVGGELWLLSRRVGLRAGFAANTIGERRPSSSAGISFAVMRALYIDGARTFGRDQSIRGWSSSVRVTF
jgi:hypothetical protein